MTISRDLLNKLEYLHIVTKPLCLLQDRPMNLRYEVLQQGIWLFAKLADWEDGRLLPLNNHLSRVWMPGSYIDQRWGWGWGNKVKRPSILQISPRMTSFKQRMCSFLPSCHLQVDRVLKKDTFSLTVRKSVRVLWGSSLCMIIITKTTKSKSKKQLQHGVRIGFSLQQFPTVQVHSTILWKGRQWSLCYIRWIFLRVSAIGASVPSVDICLLLFLLWSVYTCRLRNIELWTQEAASQVKECSAFYIWEDARIRAHFLDVHLSYLGSIILCSHILSFLSTHHSEWPQSYGS